MGEVILQMILAVVVGAIIGSERQIRVGQGVRTLSLICLGATLFTIYSDIFTDESFDPTRIAASVVTGVGFLGAGMILRNRGAVVGLTTAASVWLVASHHLRTAVPEDTAAAVLSDQLRSQSMVVRDTDGTLEPDDVPRYVRNPEESPASTGVSGINLEESEKEGIRKALAMCEGNREKAAKMLGIGERTLYRKIKKYGF